MPPIALQLYTVRDALGKNFESTIRQVAEMGYVAVETASFPGTTPQAAARLFRELGLTVCSAHQPLPLGDKQQEVIDTLGALDCTRLVCASLPTEQFKTVDGVRRACDTLNEASAVARANQLTLGYHNHWWEFQSVDDGRRAYDVMVECLSPDVFLELDVYWAKTAGADPAAVLRELDPRAPLLHIKDGPAVRDAPMVAVGEGTLDFDAIAQSSAAEWWIVELDECATDMLEAVRKSYAYLTQRRLAVGKN